MPSGIWAALAATLALAALHLAAPRLRAARRVAPTAVSSFAGGTAVAYVFLHLLPELGRGNDKVGEALKDVMQPTPGTELVIFAVALFGFALFFGAERLGALYGEHSQSSSAAFAAHIAAFTIYNGIITYTLPLRFKTGTAFAVLFTVAIGLHFVVTDRGLSRHWPERFAHWGRPVLVGALGAGWVLAALFAPTNTLVVSVLVAFVAGGILLNVFKEELPSTDESDFSWFSAGLVLYAALLAVVTVTKS